MIDPEFTKTIERLQKGESDAWRERAKARHFGDQKTFDVAGARMIAFNQQLMAALKAEGLKFNAELKPKAGESEDEKVTRLLTAFVRGTRLSRIWSDTKHHEKLGARYSIKVTKQTVWELDAMDRRGDLVVFLDDPDPSVRAKAAALLKETMPDRCIPILEDVYRAERMRDAGWIAMWALPKESVDRIHAEHSEVAAQRRRIVPEGFG